MADTKISALTAATAMADANEFPINEAGASKKLTGTLIKAWQGNILRNVNTSDVTISAGATTYATGSSISVPTGKLRAGSWFRWTLVGTKTAAGTAARSILVKIGTNGSTADATIVTLTSGTPTAAADTGVWHVTFVVRTIGAAATSHGAYGGFHQLSTTGLFPNETEVIQAAGSTFDSTTASLIVGLAITTGASEVITLQQVIAEAFNL